MKKILLFNLLMMTMLMNIAWAQERTVTGRVTSADDRAALPGVNVIIQGTTIGTNTDVDGNYRITVPTNANTLVFTFIGFASQEVQVGNRSVVDVTLAFDIQQLTEVIVTAQGVERDRKALGYAVENVSGAQIQQVSEPDALRALQGKVPGLNISGSSGAAGSETRITIRGNSSFLGNNQPLFVVDGIPFNNNEGQTKTFNQLSGGGASGSRIADLDPNNIESITVLKGGAAAALYGSRAANGVIIVTTKSGSSRASRKGLEVSFSTGYSIEQVANLPDYQNTYGTGTNFEYSQVNGSWGAPFIGTKPYANLNEIPHWYRGRPGMSEFDGVMVPYRAYPNNVRDIFRTGSVFENSISVTGGNEKSVISAVLSRTLQDGFIPNSEFNRTNISVGGNTTLENKLNVGANLSYINSYQHGPQGGANNAIGNASAFGRVLYLGRNWDLHGQPYENPLTRGSEFFIARSQADNPLWSFENAGFNTSVDRIVASANAGYDIFDWLNASYKIGVNSYSQRTSDFYRPGSRGADGLGRITNDNVNFQEIESNFILTADRDLSEDLNLRAFVGHNVNQRTTTVQAYQGTGYVTFDIDDIDNTNAVVPFGGDYSQRRLFGIFADLTLSYRDYLFLNAAARNDWSSTLPENNRSFFYPAISSSLIFTDAFNIESSVLSFGKLRAGWAQVGIDTDPYQLDPIFLINSRTVNQANGFPFSPEGGSTVPGATLSDIARNPDLKPEITTEFEIGTELQFLNNRFGIDFTYYDRRTRNQIAFQSLPTVSGFTSFLTNFGEMSNKGIELGVSITPIQTLNGFEWNIYTAFTHNKNVVESLAEGVEEVVVRATFAGDATSVLRPGQEYGLLRGPMAARDHDGNLLINPANGQLIPALEEGIIGNPNPDFLLGVTNTISFKGFTLNALVDYRHGGDLYSVTNNTYLGRGVTKDTEDREINVIIPGVYGDPNTQEVILGEDGSKIPNTTAIEVNTLYFGETFAINGIEEFSVWDATIVRLREITLGYQLPKTIISRTPFGSVNISLTGRNLWYHAPNFPPASNFDPEVNQFGADNAQGLEFNAAPSAKRYGVNLRFTF